MMPRLWQPAPAPWYTTPRFRTAALVALALLACVEGCVAVFLRDNDFLWHLQMGQEFLTTTAGHYTDRGYPIPRLLADGLMALGPHRLIRAVSFVLALLALFGCYRSWRRLAQAEAPVPDGVAAAAAVFAGALLLAYLLRDLDECGLQLFLLFFLTAALSALTAGRPARAGFWLATAAAYKVTPALFLPVLLWKRQWRAAAWMVVFLAGWTAAPVLFVGLANTLEAHRGWLAYTHRVAQVRKAYPDTLLEPQRVDNLSLAALLARNLETYPPGHPLYVDHPLFFQPGPLGPEAASVAVRGVLLVLGLALAWRFRRPWPAGGGRGVPVDEWAVLCVLCAVLSPVCWQQHLVLALPAGFLAVRATLAAGQPGRRHAAALLAVGLVVNLTRDGLVGRQFSAVLLSYKVDTFAVLVLTGLAVGLHRAVRQASAAPPAEGRGASPLARTA
jgi:hypothetical protein